MTELPLDSDIPYKCPVCKKNNKDIECEVFIPSTIQSSNIYNNIEIEIHPNDDEYGKLLVSTFYKCAKDHIWIK